jgi:hypothetical protein
MKSTPQMDPEPRMNTQSVTPFACALALVTTILATPNDARAQAPAANSPAKLVAENRSAAARTDSFDMKLKLLEAAWKRGDYDLARSLTHSLRDTVIQTQREEQSPGTSLIEVQQFQTVDSLEPAWRQWALGWKYCKELWIEDMAGELRTSEPIEVSLSFPADQATSLIREVRVARAVNGQLVEVPSQVFSEVRRGAERFCKILWMVDSQPRQKQSCFFF